MKVGKASYGEGRKNRFKIKDEDNVYRILPPVGNMADTGKWFKYYKIEWGNVNSEGKNKPFLDCRRVNYDTKEVLVESAAHVRREGYKDMFDKVSKILKDNPNHPKKSELEKKKKDLDDLLRRYNLECKFHINVVDSQGKIGLLKIGKRAMDALMAQMKVLRKNGFDPVGINGVYFNFYRTGMGRDTVYTVSPYREFQEDGSEKIKTHVMDDTFISRLADEAWELDGMYKEVTSEECDRIVKEGAVAVDQIFGTPEKATTKVEDISAEIADLEKGIDASSDVDGILNELDNLEVPQPIVEEQVETPTATVTPVATAPIVETNIEDEKSAFDSLNEEDMAFLKDLGV